MMLLAATACCTPYSNWRIAHTAPSRTSTELSHPLYSSTHTHIQTCFHVSLAHVSGANPGQADTKVSFWESCAGIFYRPDAFQPANQQRQFFRQSTKRQRTSKDIWENIHALSVRLRVINFLHNFILQTNYILRVQKQTSQSS